MGILVGTKARKIWGKWDTRRSVAPVDQQLTDRSVIYAGEPGLSNLDTVPEACGARMDNRARERRALRKLPCRIDPVSAGAEARSPGHLLVRAHGRRHRR